MFRGYKDTLFSSHGKKKSAFLAWNTLFLYVLGLSVEILINSHPNAISVRPPLFTMSFAVPAMIHSVKLLFLTKPRGIIGPFLTKPRGIIGLFLTKPRGIKRPFLTKPRGIPISPLYAYLQLFNTLRHSANPNCPYCYLPAKIHFFLHMGRKKYIPPAWRAAGG